MSLVERERDDIYGTSNVIYNVRIVMYAYTCAKGLN